MFSRSTTLQGSEEAIDDDKPHHTGGRRHRRSLRRHRKHKKEKANTGALDFGPSGETIDETPEALAKSGPANGEPRRVDFALTDVTSEGYGTTEVLATRLPFTTGLRNISLGPVAKSFAPTVFVQSAELADPPVPTGRVPRVRYGIRRTNSLPDRLNQMYRPPGAMMPSQIPLTSLTSGAAAQNAKSEEHDDLSRTSAILLLIVTTGLVAVCADFMVESIDGLVKSSTISEIFIGLIILPIVGNAAEHVTAITVAMKNKMDLSIGVAVGSSIQIALFITPLVVILGWIMDREMTLYFTLFETVCLFVSTFIVNFLVLDGRSNYLEGALLCATYVIISLVAFYYPHPRDASVWGA
jgi:Ca2+:H+ antiporter